MATRATKQRLRAPKGSGSVRQLPSGSWQVRSRGHSFTAATLAEAQQQAKKAALIPPRKVARNSPTVRDWFADWLERKKDEVRPGTWAKYESRARLHIVPLLGNKKLAALTPEDVDNMRRSTAAKKGVGPTTVHHTQMVLSVALHDAMRRGLVHHVVTTAAPAPRRESPEMLTLTDEEIDRLLKAAKGQHGEAAFIIAAKLGLRQGEVLALRWKDVNLKAPGSIRVTGAVKRDYGSGISIGETKSKNGVRLLTPLPKSVLDALTATPRTSELVFPGPTGGLWDTRNFWAHWKVVRDKAKLKRPPLRKGDPPVVPRFHDLRHTVATRLLDKGVAPQTVALVLGDTVQTVMSTYAHATARGLETAMAAVDD